MRHVAYLALSLLLLSSPAGSQPAGAAPLEDPTYAALRSARPDGETLVLSQPFTLERDAFRFDLASGSLHFLAPVDGRRVGVVFLGEGTFRLIPSTEDERRHLALVTGDDHLEVLKDSFRSLVLLFADDTAEELGQLGALEHRAPEPKAVEAYESFLAHQRRDFEVNFHARLLQDLLNTPELKSGVFLAYLDGEALPPAVAAVDPRGAEALGVGLLLGGEDSLLFVGDEVKGGFWYLCDRAGEIRTGRRSPYRPTVEALHYAIDTEVRRNEELVGTTELQLKAQSALRVVPLELASTLRLKQALYRKEGESEWVPVAFVQEKEKEDANPAVVLPETLAKGAVFELRLGYSGKEVVFDLGDGVFAVLARTSWYPNVGTFRDLADYDLTFHVPAGNEVRSVGRPLETKTEGGVLTSRWRTEGPVRVAGFNYGKFKTRERRDEVSGVTVKVLATEKGFQLVGGGSRAETVDVDFSPDSLGVVDANQQPVVGRSASKSVVDSVAIDGVNALRLYHTYFGPLPYTEVAVTQQSFFGFGQSWPTLIYMPYLAFLSSATRNVVGATGTGIDDFVEQVGFHEMAHQWWGHLVGWDSYRDQWLSEGFAEFSAALAVQHTQGWEAYGKVWKQNRDHLAQKIRSSVPIYQTGPITRGFRLSTARSGAAYQVIAYEKGAFVLHMLRMLMWDPSSAQPDSRFIETMTDFTRSFAGKAASTEDFKKVVERHMVPAMNATGDGKMDWFFKQWVYGTEIPLLKSSLKAEKTGDGAYHITGTVALEEVSPEFRALVPLWADFGKGRMASFGRLPFAGPGTRQVDVTVKLPEKPKQILANARYEVLARDGK